MCFSEARSVNMSRSLRSSFILFMALYVFLCVILSFIPQSTLNSLIGNNQVKILRDNVVSVC